MRPDADTGEEVGLCEPGELGRGNVSDVSLNDDSRRDMSRAFKVSEPLGREGGDFVVECAHVSPPSKSPAMAASGSSPAAVT